MARHENSAAILAAAEAWKNRCLLRGGSVLTDQQLWTPENVQALDRYFVQNLDDGVGDFFEKLKTQLSPAPASAKQLAAEMLWVMYLIVHSSAQSGASKRLQIRMVWEWSGEPAPEAPWLEEVLDQGVSHPGTAYNTHRWRELVLFVTMMQDWVELPPDRRQLLLNSPWKFATWLESRKKVKGRQFRHVLLYLLFPDHFERILSTSHKTAIVKTFKDEVPEVGDIDYKDRVALDRAVFQIRQELAKAQGSSLDFYEEGIEERWRPKKAVRVAASVREAPATYSPDEADEWFTKRFGDVGAWLLGAGEGGRMWANFVQQGVAAIGWGELGDLTEFDSKDAIRDSLVEFSGVPNPVNDTLALWQFSHEMKVGDVIIVKRGSVWPLGLGAGHRCLRTRHRSDGVPQHTESGMGAHEAGERTRWARDRNQDVDGRAAVSRGGAPCVRADGRGSP